MPRSARNTAFNKLRLNKKTVHALPVPSDSGRPTQSWYYDTITPHLCLCVWSTGRRVWYWLGRQNGRTRRVKLGAYPEMPPESARKAAAKLSVEVNEGRDPGRPKHGGVTIAALFEHWLAKAKRRKKTWAEDQRKFDRYFGTLRNRRIDQVTASDVAKWHDHLGEKHGPYLANRCRALLSAIYGAAHELGYDGPNPCQHVKRFPEHSRDRFLLPDEVRPFFEALAAEPPLWRDFWLICLFTGARRGNVQRMEWKQIDFAQGVWYLPGQTTKAGLPLAIVLPPPALAILRHRFEHRDSDTWVFPSERGTGPLQDPRKSWARVTKRSGIQDLRPHDLRRTLGSWQALSGASLQVIGQSLGHSDLKSTQVYARLLLDPVRASVSGAVARLLEAAGSVNESRDEHGGTEVNG